MPFVNVDRLVVIGPGSEWLWTAISGAVLAVTFIAIYRQLRLQRAEAAVSLVASLQGEWNTDRFTRSRLAFLVALRDGGNCELESYQLGIFFDRLAYLVRSGQIDRKLIYRWVGSDTRLWWSLYEPTVRLRRTHEDDERIGEDFKWLAGELAKFDRKEGVTTVYDEAYRARMLPLLISRTACLLRTDGEVLCLVTGASSSERKAGGVAGSLRGVWEQIRAQTHAPGRQPAIGGHQRVG